MITKKQAAILWAYDYKLVDTTGKEYSIFIVELDRFLLKNEHEKVYCFFDQIGDDYFILARTLENLTKEIEHKGEKFVPIVKCGAICGFKMGFLYIRFIKKKQKSFCTTFTST